MASIPRAGHMKPLSLRHTPRHAACKPFTMGFGIEDRCGKVLLRFGRGKPCVYVSVSGITANAL